MQKMCIEKRRNAYVGTAKDKCRTYTSVNQRRNLYRSRCKKP